MPKLELQRLVCFHLGDLLSEGLRVTCQIKSILISNTKKEDFFFLIDKKSYFYSVLEVYCIN